MQFVLCASVCVRERELFSGALYQGYFLSIWCWISCCKTSYSIWICCIHIITVCHIVLFTNITRHFRYSRNTLMLFLWYCTNLVVVYIEPFWNARTLWLFSYRIMLYTYRYVHCRFLSSIHCCGTECYLFSSATLQDFSLHALVLSIHLGNSVSAFCVKLWKSFTGVHVCVYLSVSW